MCIVDVSNPKVDEVIATFVPSNTILFPSTSPTLNFPSPLIKTPSPVASAVALPIRSWLLAAVPELPIMCKPPASNSKFSAAIFSESLTSNLIKLSASPNTKKSPPPFIKIPALVPATLVFAVAPNEIDALEGASPLKNILFVNNPNPGFEPTNVLDNPDKSPSLAFKSTL